MVDRCSWSVEIESEGGQVEYNLHSYEEQKTFGVWSEWLF